MHELGGFDYEQKGSTKPDSFNSERRLFMKESRAWRYELGDFILSLMRRGIQQRRRMNKP